jgi:hypothetical protein
LVSLAEKVDGRRSRSPASGVQLVVNFQEDRHAKAGACLKENKPTAVK